MHSKLCVKLNYIYTTSVFNAYTVFTCIYACNMIYDMMHMISDVYTSLY